MPTDNSEQEKRIQEYKEIVARYGYWVEPKFLARRKEIEPEALRFADAHLNAEYRELALKLLQTIEDEAPEAFGRGDIALWTAGFWYALGSINFLFDKTQNPHIKSSLIADFYGVKPASMKQRATFIKEAVGLDQLDTRFATADNAAQIQELHLTMAEGISNLLPGTSIEEIMAEMPNWGKRRTNKSEYVDRDRPTMNQFYALSERAERMSPQALEKSLRELIKKDPDFLDSYLMLQNLLQAESRQDESDALREEAYRRALMLICDSKGNWPQALMWGWLENRHIIRALETQTMYLWENGQNEAALNLFRKLLSSNPNDNIGARYSILAIRLNLKCDTWDEPFLTANGYLNAHLLNQWFEQKSKEFEAEFIEWKKAVDYE